MLGVLRGAYANPRALGGVPLLRTSDQFDAYRKGPFAMYAVREYVGADKVNLALRRLMDRFRDGRPPLPTTLDLYAELKGVTPDSLHYLLADLFEANTYWELSAVGADAEQTADGWRVSFDARAEKVVVDTAGTRVVLPMNDLIEIGVNGDSNRVLYRGLHRVRSGDQRITIDVAARPIRAGIDPRNLLIDVEPSNNSVSVRVRQSRNP